MSTVYFDTETGLIQTGLTIPPLVCMTYAVDGGEVQIVDAAGAVVLFSRWLMDPDTRFVAHSAAFDMGVMAHHTGMVAEVFAAYDAGRVSCTMIQSKLLELAKTGNLKGIGKFRLATQARYADLATDNSFERMKSGTDSWRLHYNALADVPLGLWPSDAVAYPLADTHYCRELYWHNRRLATALSYLGADGDVLDVQRHVRAHFALSIMSAWGMRTDATMLQVASDEADTQMDGARQVLVDAGLMRPNGTRDKKALQSLITEDYATRGTTPPATATGQVATTKDVLRQVDHPAVRASLVYTAAEKLKKTYLDMMWTGVDHAICPSYDVLKETGRTSSFKPNIQNLPRGAGIRQCFAPRAGNLFLSIDFNSIELRGWAQVCLALHGDSVMARRYQADPDFDPHTFFAAQLLSMSYDDAMVALHAGDVRVKEHRQFSKIANFGFPGGMGARTLVDYARGYGVTITESFASWLKHNWFATWPEGQWYLQHYISSLTAHTDATTIKQLVSGRLRAGCWYSRAANTYFQGLVADGAKLALWDVAKACYVGGVVARPVAFIHDEIFFEIPDDAQASATADRLTQIMVDAMQRVMPDVPVRAEPCLTTSWSKKAESHRQADGTWSVWTPQGERSINLDLDIQAIIAEDTDDE